MQTIYTLLRSARGTAEWTRAQLGTTNWFGRMLSRFDGLMGVAESCRVPVPVPIPYPRQPRRAAAALLTLALALPVSVATAAPAYQERDDYRWGGGNIVHSAADGRLVDVQVVVEGRNAPLYFAPGHLDRHYFQAFKGRNYALSVRNNTGQRVGVLIAVDGLNVVNGERSSLSRNESMYVLDPYESATIRGWRTSLQNVRKFVFVDEERSYAERTGQANGDMGWIRVLSFREFRPQVWRGDDVKIRDRNDGGYGEELPYEGQGKSQAPQARGEMAPESKSYTNREDGNPGTGWGERRWDPVNRTWFNAERRETDHIVLRYEYESGLRALGIHPSRYRNRTWERERGELGFSQPPRW